MSDLSSIHRELKELYDSNLLSTLVGTDAKKEKKQHYVPRPSTLEGIKNPKLEAVKAFREFSPFMVGSNINMRDKFYHFFKSIFPFNELQITRMDEASKNKALANAIVAIERCMEQGRNDFLSQDRVYDNYYQQQRLKYVMEFGDEPKYIYTDEDFIFLKTEALSMFKTAIKRYLRIKGADGTTTGMNTQNMGELLLGFFNRCLLRFESIHSYWMIDLQRIYLRRLKDKTKLSSQEINEYRQLKVCPITYGIEIRPTDSFANQKISHLVECMPYLGDIKEIVKPEVFVGLLRTYSNLVKYIENELREGRDFSTAGKADIIKILKVLPLAIELSEYE